MDPKADEVDYLIAQERLDAAAARGEPEWTVTLTVHAATREEADSLAEKLGRLGSVVGGTVRTTPRYSV